jgi:hypothetical protein
MDKVVQNIITDNERRIFESFGPCVEALKLPRDRIHGAPDGVDCYVLMSEEEEQEGKSGEFFHPHIFLCGKSASGEPEVLWGAKCWSSVQRSFLKGLQVSSDEVFALYESSGGISLQEAFFTVLVAKRAQVEVSGDPKSPGGGPVAMLLRVGDFYTRTLRFC